jgi:diguanylate cyclase (GGDEF)-like protein
MGFYQSVSIHIKIFLITLGLCLSTASLIVAIFLADMLAQNKQMNALFNDVMNHTGAISSALRVKDNSTIKDEINLLQMNFNIKSVQVYYFDGINFIDYQHASSQLPAINKTKTSLWDGHFELIYPIMDHSQVVGAVHVRTVNFNDTNIKIVQFIVLIILIAVFLSVYFEGLITKQLDDLVYAMRTVAQDNDYSIRVQKKYNDEIGGLVDSFNYMLSGIQHSEKLQRDSREQIRRLALYDVLTGLPNSGFFRNVLQQEISAAQSGEYKVAVICFNFDNLDMIQDMFGHEIHDALLKEIIKEIHQFLLKSEFIRHSSHDEFMNMGRLKGGEFAFFLRMSEVDIKKITQFVKRLIKQMQYQRMIGPHEVTLVLSFGIALYPSDGEDGDFLLKNASTAMHQIKANSKNRFAFYNTSMIVGISNKIKIENDLRKAIERGELFLHYQPKFNVHQKAIVGMEALIRWKHSTEGLILPDQFIYIAEELGLIIEIGDWVLNQACVECKSLQSQGMPLLYVSVNVSGRQFDDPSLVQRVSDALQRSQLNPHSLDLEITESILMMSDEKTMSTLQAFRDLGVRVSLDDFGTGYSSLRYLARYPINTVKIDKSFICNLEEHEKNAIIVKIIISLAHYLNLTVVAEGVETAYQLDYLMKNDCDEIQGYLISKSVDCSEFLELNKKIRTLYHEK